MESQNRYEKIFDEFLDLIEFELVKYSKNEFGLIDLQKANLGDIESDRFADAECLCERLDMYIYDYIVTSLEECLEEAGFDEYKGNYEGLIEYCKGKLPDSKWDLDVLDTICNHANEINLDNCSYVYLK